jgi:hypothetical protein
MFSIVAMVIKLKKESRVIAGVCASSREVLAGWLVVMVSEVVGTVAVLPKLVEVACFNCIFEDFLAIYLL